MEASATAAGWLSFIATVVGLGSLITQASAIEERLDPFYTSRTPEHLGSWYRRQPKKPWHRLRKDPPIGPVISASLKDGFCGHAVVDISQIPVQKPGKASWTSTLGMVHETNEWQLPRYRNWIASIKPRFDIDDTEKARWTSMKYAEDADYNYDLPPP